MSKMVPTGTFTGVRKKSGKQKRDILNGEVPTNVMLMVAYVTKDENERFMSHIHTSRECIWAKPGEDMWPEMLRRFKNVERLLADSRKTGQIFFISRGYEFEHIPTPDEIVESMKGCRFSREQIADARRILDSVEKVLDKEGVDK